MANRRNNSKKSSTSSDKSGKSYPNPRVSLWVADEDRKYASSGVIQFTKEQAYQLSELFDEYSEKGRDDEERLSVRFFLYENENGSEKAPDETGNLSYTLLTDGED